MNDFERTLESFATAEPPSAAVQVAQEKLEATLFARLATHRRAGAVAARARRPMRAWLAAGVSAVVVATLVAVILPLTSTPALAFESVRQHFLDFRTLRFDMTQEVAGQVGPVTRVSVARDGNVRTDVGSDISVIVNPAEGRMLTLIHPEHMALESPLGAAGAREDDSLRWLDEIRAFQGAAQPLPAPRTIGGRVAHGWKLRAGAMDIVLWAAADGLPLEMEMTGEQQMRFEFHFEFDAPLADSTFSTELPAGYHRAPAED